MHRVQRPPLFSSLRSASVMVDVCFSVCFLSGHNRRPAPSVVVMEFDGVKKRSCGGRNATLKTDVKPCNDCQKRAKEGKRVWAWPASPASPCHICLDAAHCLVWHWKLQPRWTLFAPKQGFWPVSSCLSLSFTLQSC